MAFDPQLGAVLLWRFIAREGAAGLIWWHWEAWTPVGQFVGRSRAEFDTLTDCERDARASGWIPPEARR